MTVITRFAPSPTGMLHIGSARTALFNYLFARHMGGQFKLRIEDTDLARNSDAAYQAILDGLNWLGLAHDGDVVYQSKNAARHREVAEELVNRGQAYYCYTTADELKAQREAAEAKGEVFKYDRRWRDTSETPPAGITPSIRIKAPLTGEVIVRDAVQGDVHFAADVLDDLVILRSDGTPTYNLAVVVDDHDMGVTHVIRGDDHLNNAGRQMVIYRAMGWDVPVFAHIPLIHGTDGAKLSKRHGATGTMEYAAMGYLPEAMRNYLARLGWGHGDDEIFSDAQAIEWFTLEHIGKAPARLDFAKLNHVNAHYLRLRDAESLVGLLASLDQITAPVKNISKQIAAITDPVQQSIHQITSPVRQISEQIAAMTNPLQKALEPIERIQKQLEMVQNPLTKALDATQPLRRHLAQISPLTEAIRLVQHRASTLIELAEQVNFFVEAPTSYDEKAAAMLAKNGANIPLILPALEALDEPWSAESVKAAIHAVAEQSGKKIGELMPPIRAAIVGAMSGPDIPDAMAILGKAETIARLKRVLG